MSNINIPNQMSGVSPVQNNNAVRPIQSTTPNPLELVSALAAYNYQVPFNLVGTFTPTAAGTYVISDAMGNPLIIPENSLILAVGMQNANGMFMGTNANIQTTETTARVIWAPQTADDINTGICGAPTLAALGPQTVGIASLVTGTTFTPAASIRVNIFFVSLV